MMNKINVFLDKFTNETAFAIATGSVLASLLLSQAAGLYPCTLCWWQRIFMFPLPFILGAAVLRRDKFSFLYVLPLSLVGTGIAAYHSLLQWGIIVEKTSACSLYGPSCAKPEIMLLGFLTIPFGAFLSFSAITILMYRVSIKNKQKVVDQNALYLFMKISGTLLALATVTYFVIVANQ